jgi:hypothetical protein
VLFKWLVDSGAHMAKESDNIFQNLKSSDVQVSLGDNSKVPADGSGSVGRVSNVLKVGSLSHNLLSVAQTLDNGLVSSVVFTKMECRFLNRSGEILVRAPRLGNLYVYNEIVKDPVWKEAMDKETSALITNDTWEDVNHYGYEVNPISCRWVYNVKRNGTHKSRLVVRGCFDKDDVISMLQLLYYSCYVCFGFLHFLWV